VGDVEDLCKGAASGCHGRYEAGADPPFPPELKTYKPMPLCIRDATTGQVCSIIIATGAAYRSRAPIAVETKRGPHTPLFVSLLARPCRIKVHKLSPGPPQKIPPQAVNPRPPKPPRAQVWYRVLTLGELVSLLRQYQDTAVQLVVGNTSMGVSKYFNNTLPQNTPVSP
jgi:hypothetical protein